MNLPCILIPVLVGLICAALGYLLGKLFGNKTTTSGTLQADLDACLEKSNKYSQKIATLEADLALSKKTISSNIQSFASNTDTSIAFDASLAASVFGKKIKQDDLKIVEGIGPKIEELYHAAGIKTWKLMSETATEKLQEILNDGGERFSVHNAGTWSRQAKLAYEGKWQELKNWQEQLDGGKE